MKKPYEDHEIEYRRMKTRGICSWNERGVGGQPLRAVDANNERFLEDVLAQSWAPRGGRAIELGCGTGPMLRWLADRGFAGLGMDVSRTAIAMAREQSDGLPVRFRRLDACALEGRRLGRFNLVLDGNCYHCITADADRRAFLENAKRLLCPGGVFVLLSMCLPVDAGTVKKSFAPDALVGDTIYVPCDDAAGYEGAIVKRGKALMPTRRVPHWQRILGEVREAGLDPRIIRLALATPEDPISGLAIAAVVAK